MQNKQHFKLLVICGVRHVMGKIIHMNLNGILYFLINDSIPGMVKIGYTTGALGKRLQQLNTTGIPSPFRTSAIFYVHDAKKCELEVHRKLEKYRENPNREFFTQTVSLLLRDSISVVGKYVESSPPIRPYQNKTKETCSPDKDDIYLMFYLLHDSYERNIPYSATELSRHHAKYAPLEIELKFMNLEKYGFIKRVNRKYEGMGLWKILPKGVMFMFDGNHHAQDLIAKGRKNA